ncbi:MAG: Ribosomal RNA small subunit methyltransferase H [Parcubacteria group bacterium Gr01-1014_46]|nr:MAG: Ribosomal RNA small subunit methyltransferase H [Parcubacteria group bacterium Gr01-1014_46]
MAHKTVLLQEAIDGLEIKNGDIFVDGTLGGGGHFEEVAKRFGDAVVMIGIDLDPSAIIRTKERTLSYNLKTHYVQDSFRNLGSVLDTLKIPRVDKILLDIGLSSNQFEESGRGFSFQKDEPLQMTFKKDLTEEDLTAREIVNTWDLENISTILKGYGEEQFAWKIAKAIVARREEKPIETTFELVEIIKLATPKWYHARRIHPATKTFQALRITVNDEIESLKEGIRVGFERLNRGGRIAVISFHSIEDRAVKQFFKGLTTKGEATLVNKKPIIPNDEEVAENPRSRSAKLRIIEKL